MTHINPTEVHFDSLSVIKRVFGVKNDRREVSYYQIVVALMLYKESICLVAHFKIDDRIFVGLVALLGDESIWQLSIYHHLVELRICHDKELCSVSKEHGAVFV